LLFQLTLRIIELVINGYKWFLLPLDIYSDTSYNKP